jgi:hypothetical protein
MTQVLELQLAKAMSDDSSAASEPPEELLLTAHRKITLQCGLASITLHPNGKIVLRGQHILSASEGTNRVVGAQVEIN